MRKPFFFIFMSIYLLSGFIISISAQPVPEKITPVKGERGDTVNVTFRGENLLQIDSVQSVLFDDKMINALGYTNESDTTIIVKIQIPDDAQEGSHKIRILAFMAGQDTATWLQSTADVTIVQYKGPEFDILYDDSKINKEDTLDIDFVENPKGIFVSKIIAFSNPSRKVSLAFKIIDLQPEFLQIEILPEIPPEDEITFKLQLSPEAPDSFKKPFIFSINKYPDTLQIKGTRILTTQFAPDSLKLVNVDSSEVSAPDSQVAGVAGRDSVPEGQTIAEYAIDFETTTVGKPIRKPLPIRNTGPTPLVLSNPKVPDGFILLDSFPDTIDAGEMATYTVELNADSAQKATGNIEFQTNITGQSLASFPVTGIVNEGVPGALPIAAVVILSLGVATAGAYFLIKGPVRNYRLRKSLSGKTTFQFKPKMDEGFQTIKQATPLKPHFEVRLKPILDYGKQTIKSRNALIRDEAIQAEKSESTKPDDLTRIEGIGPVISDILKKSGITTFRQLAEADVKKIQQMLHDAGITGIADPATWPLQAELAASKEWKQLDKLQEELKGGRVTHEKV